MTDNVAFAIATLFGLAALVLIVNLWIDEQ
jgi:hypothetical protein